MRKEELQIGQLMDEIDKLDNIIIERLNNKTKFRGFFMQTVNDESMRDLKLTRAKKLSKLLGLMKSIK